jgi:hypothetical protein
VAAEPVIACVCKTAAASRASPSANRITCEFSPATTGFRDLGYPRTVQRPDGKLVTIYYFNDRPDTERYIAATIWDPGT